MNETSTFMLSSLVALCFGIAACFNVVLARRTSALRAVFFYQALGVPLLLLGIAFFPSDIPTMDLAKTSLVGVFIALVLIVSMQALRLEKSAVVYPILQSTILVTFLLGVLFLHESVTPAKVFGLLAVFAGILALSLKVGGRLALPEWRLSKGAVLALGAAVAQGLYFFFVVSQVRAIGWYPVTLIIRVAASATILILLLSQRKERGALFANVPWAAGIGAAAFDVVGFSLYNIAVSNSELSYVQIIVSASAIVAAILGVVFLREKLSRWQIAAIALTMAGVFALQL